MPFKSRDKSTEEPPLGFWGHLKASYKLACENVKTSYISSKAFLKAVIRAVIKAVANGINLLGTWIWINKAWLFLAGLSVLPILLLLGATIDKGGISSFAFKRYDNQIARLDEIGSHTLSNPKDDLAFFQRKQFNISKIRSEFTTRAYASNSTNLIKYEIGSQAEDAIKAKRKAKGNFYIVLCFFLLQIFFFDVAVYHTKRTGIPFRKKPTDASHVSENNRSQWFRVKSHISTSASSIIMSLGIGGTFLGLIVGLYGSMGKGIILDVSILLSGLCISFTSSLSGVFLSLLVRILQHGVSVPLEIIKPPPLKSKLSTAKTWSKKRRIWLTTRAKR